LVGELAKDPVFAARVTSWFGPDQLELKLLKVRWLDPQRILSPDRTAAVHVWVTLSGDGDLARLYFAAASPTVEPHHPSSYFVRDLRLEAGLDEIGAEHIAEVLHSSTLAFLEGQAESARDELELTLSAEPISPSTPAAPTRALAPRAAPHRVAATGVGAEPAGATERARPWGASVGYGVSYRGDEGTWHGPRASLELSVQRRLGLRLAFQGALPHSRDLPPVRLTFYAARALLAGTFRQPLSVKLAFEGFAGPALEPCATSRCARFRASTRRPALEASYAQRWWPA
jgi:hypothetical protein